MRQFAWFDCLRCAAVFLVILAHCGDFTHVLPSTAAVLFNAIQSVSWAGVDLFFVLSGFLVSGLLFAEHDQTGTLDVKRFLIRRAFKIVPPFYFLLAATLLYDAFVRGRVDLAHLFHDIFFLQSYRMGAWSHAWTLAIEVHFYLLLALLFSFLVWRAPAKAPWLRSLPTIICSLLIASVIARWLNSEARAGPFNLHRELEPSHLHLDVLAAGVLLRYLYNYHAEYLAIFRRARPFWIVLGLLLVGPSGYIWAPHPAILTALIPTCNYFGFGLIVFETNQIPFPTGGIMKALLWPFDYLGKHSYSIYLWHLPVKAWLVDPFVKEKGVLYFLCFFGGSLIVGTFFSVVLEMPILRLRNHLFPSVTTRARSNPAATPGP